MNKELSNKARDFLKSIGYDNDSLTATELFIAKEVVKVIDQEKKKEAIAFLLETTGEMFEHNAEELYKLFKEAKTPIT